jgi:hypothetical protein
LDDDEVAPIRLAPTESDVAMSFGSNLGAEPVSAARQRLSWTVLLALLAGLVVASATLDRSEWPGLFGDEATYLMAAQSLAWDGDLLFDSQDYERFVSLWKTGPEGLILQSGDGGRTITYGKPFFYPVVIAPFVRLLGVRGPFIANALLLGLASILSARVLSRKLGELAPLGMAALIFASVVYVYVFQAHADLFMLCCSGIALSIVFGSKEQQASQTTYGIILQWSAVGALIGLVVYSRPLYAPLFLPPLLGLPRRYWIKALGGLGMGALIVVSLAATVHRINGGAWTSYGGERRGFYSKTGYPGVDFAAEEWSAEIGETSNAAWSEVETISKLPRTSFSLWGWNSVYFLVGRDVGLLAYFFPATLALIGWPKRWIHWSLLAAVALSFAAFFLYRPFNFYGGGGAVANRYLLALYPTLWFVANGRLKLKHLLTVVLVAAPFVWPVWAHPRAYPLHADRTYAFVSETAFRLLPYETTQSHLKPAGRSDVVHRRMWVKFLTPSLRSNRAGDVLLIDAQSRGEFLVGSSNPVSAIEIQVFGGSEATIDVLGGAKVVAEEFNADGQQVDLELGRPRAKHRMWWSWNDVFIYELKIRSNGSPGERVAFALSPTIEGSRE